MDIETVAAINEFDDKNGDQRCIDRIDPSGYCWSVDRLGSTNLAGRSVFSHVNCKFPHDVRSQILHDFLPLPFSSHYLLACFLNNINCVSINLLILKLISSRIIKDGMKEEKEAEKKEETEQALLKYLFQSFTLNLH
jgi:hypothetical protein